MMCEWCGKEFIAKRKMSKGKPRRFCGRSCSAKWRMSQPEYKRKYTEEDRKEKVDRAVGEGFGVTQSWDIERGSCCEVWVTP